MNYRKLRIVWSVGCSVLCVLLIVLWVRSYWDTTYIVTRFGQISVLPGALGIMFSSAEGAVPPGTVIHTSSAEWVKYLEDQELAYGTSPMGGHWSRVWGAFNFQNGNNVPFWFLVSLFAVLSGAPWHLRRFSLRTLLIAITLVAVGLGAIYAVTK